MMLAYKKTSPEMLAYDRPSEKLIGFLNKHFGLNSYTPQNNNYVVFHQGLDKLAQMYSGKMRLEKYGRAPDTFYGSMRPPMDMMRKKAPMTMYGGEF